MKVKNFLSFVVTGVAVMTFSGCMKNTPIEPAKPVSFVSVMNISYKAPAVEMLFNNEKVTPPINPGSYFTRYSSIDPGVRNVVFKKASSDSVVAQLATGEYYDSSEFYTILMYDNPAGGALAARITDEFPTIDQAKTYLRFFQLSADVPNVDLTLDNTKLYSNRTPADNVTNTSYNQFQAYTPGSYTLKAKLTGSDSTVATSTFTDLAAGGIYTIFLKGVKGGVGSSAFGIEVLRARN
jgi:uncharacterized protein DUF4397